MERKGDRARDRRGSWAAALALRRLAMSGALPGDLECRELVELVTDHLEGALAPEARTRLELHLAVCPGCAAYLRQLRGALGAARRGAGVPLAGEVRDRLVALFREWKRGGTPP